MKKLKLILFSFTFSICGLLSGQTINPDLIWGTYFGSLSNDYSQHVEQDNNNNIIVLSYIGGAGAPVTPNAHQQNFGGIYDIMLTKFDKDGNLIWSTYFGGEGGDFSPFFTVDRDQNIIVAGVTGSSNGIATPNAFQTEMNSESDGFVAKFNTNGQLLWSTYFGGSDNDRIENLKTDSLNQIYVVGSTLSKDKIATGSSHQTGKSGKLDAFISKFSSDGQLIWSTYYGDAEDDIAYGLAVDNDLNLLIVGKTFSPKNIATIGSDDFSYNGNGDGFMLKMDKSGNRIWGSYLGGSKSDVLYLSEFDSFGNLYVTGQTTSSNLGTSGSFSPDINGKEDVILFKFNPDGTKAWSTYFGGSEWDDIFSMTIDQNGNLILSIRSNSNNFPTTANTYNEVYNGGDADAVFIKLDIDGKVKWATYFGGSDHDRGIDMFLGKDGFLYASIITNSKGLATIDAFQTESNGYECFVFKMKDVTTVNVSDNENLTQMVVTPNPTADFIVIPNEAQIRRNITVVDTKGAVVLQFLNSTNSQFNLTQLYNGVYMVLVESEGTNKIGRVIKAD